MLTNLLLRKGQQVRVFFWGARCIGRPYFITNKVDLVYNSINSIFIVVCIYGWCSVYIVDSAPNNLRVCKATTGLRDVSFVFYLWEENFFFMGLSPK
jgi:hypothetical protein